MKNVIRFFALLFIVITLSALVAHLLELRGKINLSKNDYLIIQQVYSGWALLGVIEIAAIFLALVWLINVRKQKQVFNLILIALICFLAGVIIFFIFTFPANQATGNWTYLPFNWQKLRTQWEYSHAAHAILFFIGFGLTVIALLKEKSISR